jgi:hypothetical protein
LGGRAKEQMQNRFSFASFVLQLAQKYKTFLAVAFFQVWFKSGFQ